jgi:hypothetical protein
MKRLIMSIVYVSIISLLLQTFTFGVGSTKADEKGRSSYNNYTLLTDEEYEQYEENLLTGLISDNS